MPSDASSNRIGGLDRIEDRGDRLHVGALVRHRMTASDPVIAEHLPMLHEAMENVAHLTVRNRGTFCGSVCHADPAAEWPTLLLLLNAHVHIRSRIGRRSLSMDELLLGPMTTALGADELIESVQIPRLSRCARWGFTKRCRKVGEFAYALAAARQRTVQEYQRVVETIAQVGGGLAVQLFHTIHQTSPALANPEFRMEAL